MGKEGDEMNRNFGFNAAEITWLVLSHAHIDHCGLVPKLVKEGFRGSIFCTPGTKDLAEILLEDSAEIQRDDTKFINKKRAKQGLPPYDTLYSVEDAKKALTLFKEVNYREWFKIEEGVEVFFTDAGHIIGSAAVNLKITEQDETTAITFSGDVGQYRDVILKSPEVFPQAEYILLESTYGNRLHEDVHNTNEDLLRWINKTCVEKKGKLIIPAFSVGRTQEITSTYTISPALLSLQVEWLMPAG
jgi:metallo-beta-lactamase family protein